MVYFFSKSFFLNLLFPITCLGCNQEGSYLCSACFKNLKFCQKNYNLKLNFIDEVVIAGDYEDEVLAKLIKSFKFKSIIVIGQILADFLTIFWQGRALIIKDPLIIPLPLAKQREKWRGFNQATIIAQSFALNFGYEIKEDLKKIKHTRAQSGLSAKKRQKNITGVFTWNGPALRGRALVLLDDVITTGATGNEAARVLKEAGAGKIIALAVAKG